MLENINLNGAQVSAELHGFMYQGVYGYSGIYNFDNNCEAEIQSNNEIKIKSGLLINKGRFLRIKGTESVMIQNGSSGVNRTDLIVARFTTDGINEKHVLAVIKGTSESVPSYTNGDIYNGATACELPLYAVHLTGTKVDAVTQVCDTIYSNDFSIGQNVYNDNLVLNGNFTINQRGKSTYKNDTWTNEYTVDRWISAKSIVEPISGQGVKVTSLSTNGSSVWFKQLFEQTYSGSHTLSCMVTQITGEVYLYSKAKGVKLQLGENKMNIEDVKQVSFELAQGASVTISYVKLEKGEIATKFVAPSFGEEYTKCQWFTRAMTGLRHGYWSSGKLYLSVPECANMRLSKPTAKNMGFEGWLYVDGVNMFTISSSSFTNVSIDGYKELVATPSTDMANKMKDYTYKVIAFVFKENRSIQLDAEIY